MTGVFRTFFFLTGLVAGFLFALGGPAVARTLALADLRHEVMLADPQISPDGARVALLVAPEDFDHDRYAVRIELIDVATGRTHVLPTAATNISFIRWSPSGDRIAYLAANGDGPMELYVMSPAGGSARRLTTAMPGVDEFVWRPDGRAIAYATQDETPARHGSDRFNTSFEVGDNDYLATAKPSPAHLWLVSSAGGTPRPLTRGASMVPFGYVQLSQPYLDTLTVPQHFPDQFFCWLGGGRTIAYTRVPDAYATHWDRAVMMLRDVASGQEQPLTMHEALEAGCDSSPDGSRLAYWYPHDAKPLGASDIFVTGSRGGEDGVDATHELDRAVWVVRWMPDGKSLLVLAHDATREGMWIADARGDKVRRLDLGDLNASAASVSRDGTIAFIGSGPTRPSELYVLRPPAAPRKLSSYNAYFDNVSMGRVARVDWSNDGFPENGVLTYPPGYVAGRRYPLVLQIHGWPQYASQEAFDTDYPGLTQLFATHGYLVFEPNYRGSDDMGTAFETAIVGDTVAGPASDVMAGIAAVEKLGIVDTTRIAVTGWSYGGLITAWLIGHGHFAAAMAGAAPTDIPVDYAIGSYNVLDRYFYGGELWSSRAMHERYVDQSPITDAWDVTTPTLIMSAIYDTIVPVTHSFELYRALRERGVPTQFFAYVSSEHYPSDPVQSEDIYRRWVGWLDRYLR